jgi:RNA polymerase sigma-70 factor (ECF subfamily)
MAENEIALLQAFVQDGETEAFSGIVRRHAGMVYGAGLRVLKDDSRAADVVQETFLQLLRDADRITGSLASWLHRTAIHKAIDAMRRDERRRRREAKYAVNKVCEMHEWERMSGHVDEAVDELDDEKRELLIQRFFEGRTMAEMAAERGISQPTISRQIESTLGQLRKKLRSRGVLVVAGVLGSLLGENAVEAAPAIVLKELGKITLVVSQAAAASGATTGATVSAAGAKAAAGGVIAGVKAKIITAAAVTAVGVGGVATYQHVTSPAEQPKPAKHTTSPVGQSEPARASSVSDSRGERAALGNSTLTIVEPETTSANPQPPRYAEREVSDETPEEGEDVGGHGQSSRRNHGGHSVFTVISIASPEQEEPGSAQDANSDSDSEPPAPKGKYRRPRSPARD